MTFPEWCDPADQIRDPDNCRTCGLMKSVNEDGEQYCAECSAQEEKGGGE